MIGRAFEWLYNNWYPYVLPHIGLVFGIIGMATDNIRSASVGALLLAYAAWRCAVREDEHGR